jgi:L-lactate dehydrogenase complex protein LldF
MGGFGILASNSTAWKAALLGGKLLNVLPPTLIPVPALHAWTDQRTLPPWRGGEFRKWMKNRKR